VRYNKFTAWFHYDAGGCCFSILKSCYNCIQSLSCSKHTMADRHLHETHRTTISELLALQDVLFQASLLPPDLLARLSVLSCRLWQENEALEVSTYAAAVDAADTAAALAAAEEQLRISAVPAAASDSATAEQLGRRHTAPPRSTLAPPRDLYQPPAPPPRETAKAATSEQPGRSESEARMRSALMAERWKGVQERLRMTAEAGQKDAEAEVRRAASLAARGRQSLRLQARACRSCTHTAAQVATATRLVPCAHPARRRYGGTSGW
jgi:hypothetical protein